MRDGREGLQGEWLQGEFQCWLLALARWPVRGLLLGWQAGEWPVRMG